MNRLLSILISIVLLFLIYIWISHITEQSGAKELSSRTKTRVLDKSEVDQLKTKYKLSNYKGQPHIENKAARKPDMTAPRPGSQNTQPEKSSTNAGPEQPEVKETSPTQETTTPPTRPNKPDLLDRGSNQGNHLVIAGNFLQRTNAQKQVNKLVELGYQDAEVVRFELSEYFTVCAARFEDALEARMIAKKLEDAHRIDTYVRVAN